MPTNVVVYMELTMITCIEPLPAAHEMKAEVCTPYQAYAPGPAEEPLLAERAPVASDQGASRVPDEASLMPPDYYI